MLIDLNADLGEGAGHDAELMRWITSANICCGAHAGGPEEMRATVELAQRQASSSARTPATRIGPTSAASPWNSSRTLSRVSAFAKSPRS